MCSGGDKGISDNELFSKRFQFAWEHFRYHADQRVRMFHFFILFLGLFGSAFALMFENPAHQFANYAFLVFYAGGVVSTIFLSLDIRNAQLLDYSEDLLKKLEDDILFREDDWREDLGRGEIRLGILSREAILKEYRKSNHKTKSNLLFKYICFYNVSHTFSIRFLQFVSMVIFWLLAFATVPASPHDEFSLCGIVISWTFVTWGLFGLSFIWSIWALARPNLDSNDEIRALT